MNKKPHFINSDEVIREVTRRCNVLDKRLKGIDPHFDAGQMIHKLINMGEMQFGYEDEDVKYLRETVLKLNNKDKVDGLIMYTIYESPLDYPNFFVVRKWIVGVSAASPISDGVLGISKTLDGARELLPLGCTCLPRDANDEAQIVESWL